MLKSKVFMMITAVLIAITLILTAAFILWNYMDSSADPRTQAQHSTMYVESGPEPEASKSKENTVLMESIQTNLAGQGFIQISFAFELENKKAKEEFELIDFKMKALVIQSLAEMSGEQISGAQGIDALTSALMNKMNPLLTKGKLRQIYVTNKIISNS